MKKSKYSGFTFTILLMITCCSFIFSCRKIDNITYEELKDDLAKTEQEQKDNSIIVPSFTLYDLLSQEESTSLMLQALAKAGLEDELKGDGPLTLFVPSNAAVDELFNQLGADYNSFDDFDSLVELQVLTSILSYHIVEANMESSSMEAGEIPTLYGGNTIEIKITNDSFVIGDATPVDAKPLLIDNKATNGTIHVIDKILLPKDVIAFLGNPNFTDTSDKTIKELLEENEDFEFLKEALILTGLLETLNEEGPFTVFAPTNETLLIFLGYLGDEFSSLDDFTGEEEIDLLREILLYHVLGQRLSTNDFVLGSITTLSGDNELRLVSKDDRDGEFSLADGLEMHANFGITDIQAKNGIVHTIDRILIPESIVTKFENEIISVFENAMLNIGELNMALDILKLLQDELDVKSLMNKEFTFFLPSDEAFRDLFNKLGVENLQTLNNDEDQELLVRILSYHLVESGKYTTDQLASNMTLNTQQGEELTVEIESEIYILDKTGVPAKIIYKDQEVLNGIIHVVDKVLLPSEILNQL